MHGYIVKYTSWFFNTESNITDAGDETQPLNDNRTRNSCPSDKYLELPARKSTPG